MTILLAADIGGTKSDLAIFELGQGESRLLVKKRYENGLFEGIEAITASFLSECSLQPSVGCFAVAGLIKKRQGRLTNLPWSINCDLLEQHFGFEQSYLINDLTAVASSLSSLKPEDLMVIQEGSTSGGRIKGVIAPGTGLGQGFVVDTADQLFVSGSEGGHTDFGPVNEEQVALLQWMQKRNSVVSYEMVIAGPGLMNLYDFYKETSSLTESGWVRDEMDQVTDRTPVIVAAAIQKSPCPLCVKVVELFLSILGSEAGNLALKLYATGGIYLGGGILPRLKDTFGFSRFLQSFNHKGVMMELLQTVPVYLILRTDTALFGVKNYACREMGVKVRDGA